MTGAIIGGQSVEQAARLQSGYRQSMTIVFFSYAHCFLMLNIVIIMFSECSVTEEKTTLSPPKLKPHNPRSDLRFLGALRLLRHVLRTLDPYRRKTSHPAGPT